MSKITVWTKNNEVQLVQLSENVKDGGVSEQITYLSTLPYLEGFNCVSSDYHGTVPDSAPAEWRWNGTDIEVTPYVPPPEPVPDSVDAAQIRLFLLQRGLLQQVVSLINASSEATKIEWEYRTRYHRQSPILLGFAQALNLTPAQLDDWFRQAAKL